MNALTVQQTAPLGAGHKSTHIKARFVPSGSKGGKPPLSEHRSLKAVASIRIFLDNARLRRIFIS